MYVYGSLITSICLSLRLNCPIAFVLFKGGRGAYGHCLSFTKKCRSNSLSFCIENKKYMKFRVQSSFKGNGQVFAKFLSSTLGI